MRVLPVLALLLLLLPASAAARWHPRPTTKPWQIQLAGKVDTKVAAPVVEVDCDATSSAVVRAFHRRGVKVLGYLDAGSWESYRSDATEFPDAVLGKGYEGYPDERWLDIRQVDVLLPIIARRLKTCAAKGFDGADPDNLNGWENDTGFPLTAADQVRFDRAVARAAHAAGLAVTLKNTGPLVARLIDVFDGAVTESCFQYHECGQYQAFIKARKPVYAIEYRRTAFCAEARRRGFSAIYKRLSLSAFRGTC